MSGADDGLGGQVSLLDAPLLGDEDLLRGQLECQVLPHNHHAIGRGQDLLKVVQPLHVLDLRNHLHVTSIIPCKQLPDRFNILRAANQGDSHHLELHLYCELFDVQLVLLVEDRDAYQVRSGQVHRSLLSEDVIVLDFYHDAGVGHFGNFTLKRSIVDQNARSQLHCLAQLLIVRADAGGITLDRAVNHDLVLLTGAKLYRLALLECASEE